MYTTLNRSTEHKCSKVSHFFCRRGGAGDPPQQDKGQIHHNSRAQSKDKGWLEGIKEDVGGGRMLGSRSGGVGGTVQRERKVLGVKSRACFYALPGE